MRHSRQRDIRRILKPAVRAAIARPAAQVRAEGVARGGLHVSVVAGPVERGGEVDERGGAAGGAGEERAGAVFHADFDRGHVHASVCVFLVALVGWLGVSEVGGKRKGGRVWMG